MENDDFLSLGLQESDFTDNYDDNYQDFDQYYESDSTNDEFSALENESGIIDETDKDKYVTNILARKGIDRNAVRIQEDDGTISTVSFDELTDAEKESLLNMQEESSNGLTDEEVDIINYLRQNNLSMEDYEKYIKDQAIKEYINTQKQDKYTVDDVSDIDLMRFDLEDKYPDFTDEEIDELLQQEMSNETIFNRKVAMLRREYSELEDNYLKEQDVQAAEEHEAEYRELYNTLVDTARNTNYLYGFELDDADKQEILDYLLERDINGQPQFNKLFSNPDALFKMAWFALKGGDAFKATNDYWEKQLSEARRETKVVKNDKVTTRRKKDEYGMDKYFK